MLRPAIVIGLFCAYFCSCAQVVDVNGCQVLKSDRNVNAADFTIVGLFPIHGHTSNDDFYYNHNGLIWSEAAKYFIDKINADGSLLKNITIGYVLYDTCSELYLALPAVLNVMLDEDDNDGSIFRYHTVCTCLTNRSKSYIGILGDAASSISTAVSNLLSVDLIPQISYSSTSISLSDKTRHPSFLRTIPSDDYQVTLIVNMVRHFNWTYVSVVSGDDAYGRIGMQQLVPALKAVGVCLAVEEVFNTDTKNREKINAIVQDLKNNPYNTVIILWAQRPHAVAFIEQASIYGLYGKVWIGTEGWAHHDSILRQDPKIISGLIAIAPVSGQDFSKFKSYFSALGKHSSSDSPWIGDYFDIRNKVYALVENETQYFGDFIHEFSLAKIGFVSDAVHAFAHALDGYIKSRKLSLSEFKQAFSYSEYLKYLRNVSFIGEMGARVSFDRNGDVNDAAFYLKKVERNALTNRLEFRRYGFWNSYTKAVVLYSGPWFWPHNSTEPPSSHCSSICLPGWYDEERGTKCCWHCIKCPDGFYKNVAGNKDNCTKCPWNTISNVNRSACLILKLVHLKVHDPSAIILLLLSSLGVATSTFTMLVFYKYRRTPVVRSSNIILSMVQLASIELVFITPALYIGKPTTVTCILRSALPCLMFMTCVVITFIKTEYILRIFKQTTLLSSKNIMISKTIEIASVGIMTSLHVVFTIGLHVYARSDVIGSISKEDVQIQYNCQNESFHLCAQIIFVLLFTLVCLMQAFRAKSLPQSYNEAKKMTFAMLTLSLTLVLTMLFSVSLSEIEQRHVAMCLLFFIGDFSLIIFMYSYKVTIIIFYKKENTRAKFLSDRLSFVQEEVSRKISKIHPEQRHTYRQSTVSITSSSSQRLSRLSSSSISSKSRSDTVTSDISSSIGKWSLIKSTIFEDNENM